MRKIILLTAVICSLSFNAIASSSDRTAVVEAVENFYIGDKTGSKAHRIKSMHPDGAYRYVNKKVNTLSTNLSLMKEMPTPHTITNYSA